MRLKNEKDMLQVQFAMPIDQLRLLAMTIRKYNPKAPSKITITFKEWNNTIKASHNRAHLKAPKAISDLANEQAQFGKSDTKSNWIKGYSLKDKVIEITLNEELHWYFTKVHHIIKGKMFDQMIKLKSHISMRLYFWAKASQRYKFSEQIEAHLILTFQWLRDQFLLNGKHKDWKSLRGITIDNPVYDINDKTDLTITPRFFYDSREQRSVTLHIMTTHTEA